MQNSIVCSDQSSESSEGIFEDLQVLKQIIKPSYITFLCYSSSASKHMIIKSFDEDDAFQRELFRREARIESWTHKNLVPFYQITGEESILPTHQGKQMKFSYILMDTPSNGDLYSFVTREKSPDEDETMTRTLFSGLISSLEFIHSKGLAHTDIRPENIYIDQSNNLRLGNFHFSQQKGDSAISTASGLYRAPELNQKSSVGDPKLADVYSAGIILIILKYREFPYWIGENDEKYWTAFFANKKNVEDEDFKELVLQMVDNNPYKRPSLKEIKESKWFKRRIFVDPSIIKAK